MKFVGYMLFVLSFVMLKSYAYEREILWKMLKFDHGYVTCLYVPFYLVGNVCTEYVVIFLVYVSFLACCSALCLFEKHSLAFVDLIHALPTRGRDSNPIHALGETCATRGEFLNQRGETHLFRRAYIKRVFGSHLTRDY
jgi:hypothetical protein